LIFDEGLLQVVPIDLEFVDITRTGHDILYEHLNDQIKSFEKLYPNDLTNLQTEEDSLHLKLRYLRKKENEIYETANLKQIRKEFFLSIEARQPIIRYVPVTTAAFYRLICQYPPRYRFEAVHRSVRAKLKDNKFSVDLEVWTEDFIKNKMFGGLSNINIPMFGKKRERVEGNIRIEQIICAKEVITTRIF